MWVRSQNKKRLMNCTEFHVTQSGAILGCTNPDDEGVVLATYENETRAIEVVGYIHSLITKSLRQDYIEKGVRHTSESVFIMPNK